MNLGETDLLIGKRFSPQRTRRKNKSPDLSAAQQEIKLLCSSVSSVVDSLVSGKGYRPIRLIFNRMSATVPKTCTTSFLHRYAISCPAGTLKGHESVMASLYTGNFPGNFAFLNGCVWCPTYVGLPFHLYGTALPPMWDSSPTRVGH